MVDGGAAPRIAMVAGEASGDLLAGLLLAALRRRWPALVAQGIGGPQMAAQGFDAWWPHERLAVRGYAEVLRHYRGLVALRRELGDRLLAERPDLFIGVDAPDFNLGLEQDLRAAGGGRPARCWPDCVPGCPDQPGDPGSLHRQFPDRGGHHFEPDGGRFDYQEGCR